MTTTVTIDLSQKEIAEILAKHLNMNPKTAKFRASYHEGDWPREPESYSFKLEGEHEFKTVERNYSSLGNQIRGIENGNIINR